MAVTTGVLLVLRALGLGDLLTAVPALRALRRTYPHHRIVLAAPATAGELLPVIDAIDEVLPTRGLDRLNWTGPGPELAVNLHGSGPESTRLLKSIAPQRLYTHSDGPPWNSELHEVDRWCRFLEYYGIKADPGDLELRSVAVSSPAAGVAVLHPGAGYPARRWPAARFAELGRWLADRGHEVVLTGDESERPLCERVAKEARLPAGSVLAGRTRLDGLAALVQSASLVVCGDTGIAHLATAYRTPSVVLFGPVSPRLWGPPAERPQHVALWAGRTGDPFAQRPDPGLLRISVDQVITAAERLLGEMKGGVDSCVATVLA